MKELLKYIFCPNWVLIDSDYALWSVTKRDYNGNIVHSEEKRAIYKFYYSDVRCKIKLVCSGYFPKEHDFYSVVALPRIRFHYKRIINDKIEKIEQTLDRICEVEK